MLMTLPQLLTSQEVTRICASLQAADWQDGQQTAGTLARHVKTNQQLAEHSELAQQLGQEIMRRLSQHPLFISAALPDRIYPPKFNRYHNGGQYGKHIDSALMPLPNRPLTLRTDLSATLFFCEPDDYDGGELAIQTHYGEQRVKLPAGDMVLYPASSLHEVTPVTRGVRLAAFFWVQSLVRDHQQREQLFELDQCVQRLTLQLGETHTDVVRLSGIYHNLLRQWADT